MQPGLCAPRSWRTWPCLLTVGKATVTVWWLLPALEVVHQGIWNCPTAINPLPCNGRVPCAFSLICGTPCPGPSTQTSQMGSVPLSRPWAPMPSPSAAWTGPSHLDLSRGRGGTPAARSVLSGLSGPQFPVTLSPLGLTLAGAPNPDNLWHSPKSPFFHSRAGPSSF